LVEGNVVFRKTRQNKSYVHIEPIAAAVEAPAAVAEA